VRLGTRGDVRGICERHENGDYKNKNKKAINVTSKILEPLVISHI
jgi:hypothetical protein